MFPNLILMLLFVSLNLVPFALVICHCLTLSFPPTKVVTVLTDCLMLYLSGMNNPGLVIIFADVVNNVAVGELAELFGQLRTSSLSILLIPNQWFEGEKGDSDISKLPCPSFALLLPKSWCGIYFRPKSSICWDGVRTNFFRFMAKPTCWGRKVNVSLLIKISFNVFSIRRICQNMSLDDCSITSIQLLVSLIVLKIPWEQALI